MKCGSVLVLSVVVSYGSEVSNLIVNGERCFDVLMMFGRKKIIV